MPCLPFVRLALLFGVLLLAACGFHPVYAPAADGADGPAAQGLAAINVGVITERPGQLLRQALQERFERSGLAVPRRYDLFVTYSISSEAVSIQQDSSNTRVRLVGRADYRLLAQDATRTTLASGSARSVDALNVFDQQFFALDLETETIQRRIAEDMASQIALQLAIYFNKHALAAAK